MLIKKGKVVKFFVAFSEDLNFTTWMVKFAFNLVLSAIFFYKIDRPVDRPHGSLKIRKHWTCNFVIDKSGSFDSDLVPFNVSDRLKVRFCVRR